MKYNSAVFWLVIGVYPIEMPREGKNRAGHVPRSFILLCEIGFLQLCLCAVVGEEGEHKNHGSAVNIIKSIKSYIYLEFFRSEHIGCETTQV